MYRLNTRAGVLPRSASSHFLYSCYCLSVDQFMSHHSDKLAKEGEAVDGDRAVSAATSRQPLCHFAPAPASVTLHCTP